MFEPLRTATDYRFLEIHGDTNDTCLSLIKVRVYFELTYDIDMKKLKSSIDYKFIIQRILMPERKLIMTGELLVLQLFNIFIIFILFY